MKHFRDRKTGLCFATLAPVLLMLSLGAGQAQEAQNAVTSATAPAA